MTGNQSLRLRLKDAWLCLTDPALVDAWRQAQSFNPPEHELRAKAAEIDRGRAPREINTSWNLAPSDWHVGRMSEDEYREQMRKDALRLREAALSALRRPQIVETARAIRRDFIARIHDGRIIVSQIDLTNLAQGEIDLPPSAVALMDWPGLKLRWGGAEMPDVDRLRFRAAGAPFAGADKAASTLKAGGGGYSRADAPLVEAMRRLVEDKHMSVAAAARELAPQAAGGGTPDSKAKRLERAYRAAERAKSGGLPTNANTSRP